MQDEQQAPSERQGKKRGGRGSAGSSVDALAEGAVRKLSSKDPPLQLAGQDLQFQSQREMVSHAGQCLQLFKSLAAHSIP